MEVKEMTANITPLHDRVLVRRLEEKETAKGGIIIPDTAKEKPHEGEVMAGGAGKIEKGHRIPLDGIRQKVDLTRTEDFGRSRSTQSPERVKSNGKTECNW